VVFQLPTKIGQNLTREILTLKLCEGNVDASFDSFNATMSGLVDRHLPKVKLTRRQLNLRFQKPWITKGILKSIAKRDFFFRKFVRSKTLDSKTLYHNQFKRYRNMIVSLCRRSKTNHFANYFDIHSNNVQKIWQGVRDIISLKSSKSLKPISLKINGAVTFLSILTFLQLLNQLGLKYHLLLSTFLLS